MATKITNQATLNYMSGSEILSTSSNTASVTMQGPLEVTKYSLENSYQIGDSITYSVFVTNTSANALTNVTIADDLGTYAIHETMNVTPLTYTGPAKVFINDAFYSTVNGVVSAARDEVSFTIDSLSAGSSLLLEYKATVNQYAGAIVGTSMINNIAAVTASGFTTPITATSVLPVASYADVVIEKGMSPDPVVDGSTLTYTFHIRNYGTIAATDVTLLDVFEPAPLIANVTVDNVAVLPTDYSFDDGTFLYPATTAAITYTIPAATYTQNPVTGIVTVIPGTSTIVIQGTI